MTTLLLRSMRAQFPNAEWKTDDYAVLDGETVIGRIYRIDGGPQHDHWRWALNHIKFYEARRGEIMLGGVAESLDGAKVEIKAEYERWLAGQ